MSQGLGQLLAHLGQTSLHVSNGCEKMECGHRLRIRQEGCLLMVSHSVWFRLLESSVSMSLTS